MANSLKVIPELLPKVRNSLTQQGFPSQTAFSEHIGISRATVTKFFTGKLLGTQNFQEICHHLGLDWRELAMLEDNQGDDKVHDWGNAPQTENDRFYGRKEDLKRLNQWIIMDKMRLVSLSGMLGMGKTALGVKFARDNEEEFVKIIYRSLKTSQSLEELLNDLLKSLSNQILTVSLEIKLARLIDWLVQSRCLLILDDAESLFDETALAGVYKQEYESYQTLFRRIAEAPHQSCLLLISREKPKDFDYLENRSQRVKSLLLEGLNLEETDLLLKEKGVLASNSLDDLVTLYRGNPLQLKLVGERVKDLFGGNIQEFLEYATINFDSINGLIELQYQRLSDTEKAIIDVLATENTPLSFGILKKRVNKSQFSDGIVSLKERGLIEQTEQGFILYKLVKLYVEKM